MGKGKYDHLRSSLELLLGPDPEQPDLLDLLEELEAQVHQAPSVPADTLETQASIALAADRDQPDQPSTSEGSAAPEEEAVIEELDRKLAESDLVTQVDESGAFDGRLRLLVQESLVARIYAAEHLEDASELLGDPSPWVRRNIAKRSPGEHRTLGLDSAEVVRIAVAQTSADPGRLQALASDSSAGVRNSVASNPSTDPTTLMILTGDSSAEVVLSALRNPSLSKSTLRKALNAGFEEIVAAALKNPSLEKADLEAVIETQDLYRGLFTSSLLLDESYYAALIANTDPARRNQAIANSARVVPVDIANWALAYDAASRTALASSGFNPHLHPQLIKDPAARVRVALAKHQIESTLLTELALDPVPLVRLSVAENTASSPETLQRLAADTGSSFSQRRFGRDELDQDLEPFASKVAFNPSAPRSALEEVVASGDPQAAWRAAAHPNTSLEVIKATSKLFADAPPNEEVWSPILALALNNLDRIAALDFLSRLGNWQGDLQKFRDTLDS